MTQPGPSGEEDDRIPAESFFPDGDTGGADPSSPGGEFREARSIEDEAFYDDVVEEEGPGPLDRWALDPRMQAGVFALAGFFGVFVEQANPVFQLVVGAPVFEELLKFGIALGAATLLSLDNRLVRFLLAAAAGAGFGMLEHAITYPGEPAEVLRFRVAFHAAAPALSMALYDAVQPLDNHRVRWGAIIPAALVHWLNNFVALLLGVAGVVTGGILQGPALTFAEGVAMVTLLAALLVLVLPRAGRIVLQTLWRKATPERLTRPPDPMRGRPRGT